MRTTLLATGAVLALAASGPAYAQTTGTGLATPGAVQSSGTAPSATDGPSGGADRERKPDPWERFNRKSYNFSMALDRAAIGPVARAYKRGVPKVVRSSVHNMIQNIGEPVVFVNDVLQLRLKSAAGTLCRFVGNSTLGVGGIVDVGARTGIPHHDNGFGVTMGRYGVGAGPYLYVPVLGPSTVRDSVGSGVDAISDPLFYSRFPGDTVLGVSRTVVGGVDLRANVDDELNSLETTATDPYATIRSAYLQNKQSQIKGGDTSLDTLPDFPDEPGAAPGSASPGAPASAGMEPLPDMPADPAAPSAPAVEPAPPSTNPT